MPSEVLKNKGIEIETSDSMMKFLINNCVIIDSDAIKEHEMAVGKTDEKGVNNSKWMSKWDIRYNGIVYHGFKYNFEYVRIERGNLWTAIAAYNSMSEELFLVFKMNNLDTIMKNPFEYHYLPIFNSGNEYSPPLQQSFNFDSEIEDEIKQEYNNLYNELVYSLNINPKKVIACGFTNHRFEARIYNNNQELVYVKDYTYLISPQFNDLGFALDDQSPMPTSPSDGSKLKLNENKKRIVGLKKSN